VPVLTKRQMEVIVLAAQGLINKDIGEALGIAEQTVKHHVKTVSRKLDKHSKMQTVTELIRLKHLVWDQDRERLIVNPALYGPH